MNRADKGHNMLCPYEDEKQRQEKRGKQSRRRAKICGV